MMIHALKKLHLCQSLRRQASSSNQDLYSEFPIRSGRHVISFERYGFPINNSENVSFAEYLSCDEIPNTFDGVKKSQLVSRKQDMVIF